LAATYRYVIFSINSESSELIFTLSSLKFFEEACKNTEFLIFVDGIVSIKSMTTSSVQLPDQSRLILADAHVHIYRCFNLTAFLESALLNFQASSAACGSQDNFTGLLFLTETRQENYFRELAEVSHSGGNSEKLPNWTILTTEENCSLYARSSFGRGVYLLAGRQIVTAEDLEVLALATVAEIREGLPLAVTIQEVIDQDGIPVIPWGFGKWFGRRGTLLGNLLQQTEFPTLCLGDNSGRPGFWPKPVLFKQVEQKPMRILPGTDPLPFASEGSRPGKYGFAVAGNLDPAKPAASIKQLLADTSVSIQPYGILENPWRFIQNQIAMQLVKRNRRKS
jgi:hypothetical protein